MKQREMTAVVESHFRKIDEILPGLISRFRAEDIHLFRVEIKRLRSFLHLLNADAGGPGLLKKLPKRLKDFYRVAGHIRNLQLHQQNIQNAAQAGNVQPKLYLSILASDIMDKARQAENILKGRETLKLEKSYLINRLPEKIDTRDINKFVEHEVLNFWQFMLQQYFGDQSLHEIRKILSRILYTWPYFGKETISHVAREIASKDDIKSLTATLGQLHDACIGLELLQKNITRVQAPCERQWLQNIEEQWEEQKKGLKTHIYESLFIDNCHLEPGFGMPASTNLKIQ